jgi:hypothetical protein
VVLFSPLARHYTTELNRKLQRSQGHRISAKKAFFTNFWAAWSSTMKPEPIRKSFQATGVWPMDAEPVPKRFNNSTSRQDHDSKFGDSSSGDIPKQLLSFFEAAIANKAKVQAKRLSDKILSLQVNNKLLREEI